MATKPLESFSLPFFFTTFVLVYPLFLLDWQMRKLLREIDFRKFDDIET
jgi:hypothetical protein